MPRWELDDLPKKYRQQIMNQDSKERWLANPAIHKMMKEKLFQDHIIKLATARGWDWTFHDLDSRKNRKGKPDLELGHSERGLFIMAELKSKYNKPKDHQIEAIEKLRKCGIKVYIWYPRHWEEIVNVLW